MANKTGRIYTADLTDARRKIKQAGNNALADQISRQVSQSVLRDIRQELGIKQPQQAQEERRANGPMFRSHLVAMAAQYFVKMKDKLALSDSDINTILGIVEELAKGIVPPIPDAEVPLAQRIIDAQAREFAWNFTAACLDKLDADIQPQMAEMITQCKANRIHYMQLFATKAQQEATAASKEDEEEAELTTGDDQIPSTRRCVITQETDGTLTYKQFGQKPPNQLQAQRIVITSLRQLLDLLDKNFDLSPITHITRGE